MITQTFEHTGGTQSWTVPLGVTRVTVELWGGQGYQVNWPDGASRGLGGYLKADVTVTPGTTYTIFVGGVGLHDIDINAFGGAVGGDSGFVSGGGTLGLTKGGGGGGSSEFRLSSTRVLVAGGGGGAGGNRVQIASSPPYGGHGGGSSGQAGVTGVFSNSNVDAGHGGGGGTQSGGGAGGAAASAGGTAGSAGTSTAGGDGGNEMSLGAAGAGGGGGFFSGGGGGGGRGAGGGGGGGSSYSGHTSVVTGSITNTQGVRGGNGRVIVAYKEIAPSVPTSITPAAGAVLNVADPTLTANFTVSVQQARAKVEWTLANDPGFTENVRVYLQPDSALQRGAVSAASYRIGSQASDQTLSQGTWYIRARTIDENGTSSSFSGSQSFRVEYPPTTINHFPTGNVAVAFVAAGNVFAWDFISPSPNNDQIAYQAVVETNAGVVIRDTGRIESVSSQTIVAIPSARKGEQLRWRVRVWDSDNIQGPYSDYQLFRVVDGPIVAIDNMTTVNTANPTVTFTATPPVNSSITQKRLYITRDSDNSIVYDSGWQ